MAVIYANRENPTPITQYLCTQYIYSPNIHILISDAPVVTIASFARQLVVITSKQRPRKLTIHGSDGDDYAFLLKGHEDLRQDERVMQVFPLYHYLPLSMLFVYPWSLVNFSRFIHLDLPYHYFC